MLAFSMAACGAGIRRYHSITWLCGAPPQPSVMRTSSAIPGAPLPHRYSGVRADRRRCRKDETIANLREHIADLRASLSKAEGRADELQTELDRWRMARHWWQRRRLRLQP
jgi:hypothetical protein